MSVWNIEDRNAWTRLLRRVQPSLEPSLGRCIAASLLLASLTISGCADDEPQNPPAGNGSSAMGSNTAPGMTGMKPGMGTNTAPSMTGMKPGMGTNTTPGMASSTGNNPGSSTGNNPGDTKSGSSTDTSTASMEGQPKKKKLYTRGHADIAISFNTTTKRFKVELDTDRATIDGVPDTSIRVPLSDVLVQTPGKFLPPESEFDKLAPLCVKKGESLHWFPADNTESDKQNAPFFGWSSRVAIDEFVEDRIHIHLVSATSSVPGGHFSMWRYDVLNPLFYMSTCDGIDDKDVMSMTNNHVHRHINLSGPPAMWDVVFEIRATRQADQQVYRERFTVHIQTL